MIDLLALKRLQARARDIEDACSALETALAIAQGYDPDPEYWARHIETVDAIRLVAKIRMDELISAEMRREL